MKNLFTATSNVLVRAIFLLCCFATSQAIAQIPTKINVPLRAYIDYSEDHTKQTHLSAHGDVMAIKNYVESHKGHFKYGTSTKAFFMLPVGEIEAFSKQTFVTYIGFNLDKGQTLNDVSRVRNNINPIHNGAGNLPQGYTGKGVVVGIIDTGGEIAHPDFIDSLGNTRIVRIWDQEASSGPPSPYGYGVVWDSTDINLGNCTHVDNSGHGSAVMGTAVGNGLSDTIYKGMAPEATIVIVESDFGSPNWTSTVADAVDYIFKVADTLGMPCVINTSLGTIYGSHDGRDDAGQYIEDLIDAKPGRVLVAAAGNSGNLDFHLGHDIDSDTSFTYFKVKAFNANSILPYDAIYFDIWADSADFVNVNFALGADTWTWNYRGETQWYNGGAIAGTVVYDTIRNSNNDILTTIEFYTEIVNGRYHMTVHGFEPDSIYPYRFMTTGTGHLDIWSAGYYGTSGMVTAPLPTVAQVPEIIYYEYPDINQTIVSSWNCSEKVISVANWVGRKQYTDYNLNTVTVNGVLDDIHSTSSYGPNRNNVQKPNVAATGQITISAGSFFLLPWQIANEPHKVAPSGLHARNGGTSQAAPVVTGIAALMLEQCPNATWQDVMDAVQNTARSDSFTGTTPNNIWGYGKVDGFEALLTNVFSINAALTGDTVFCQGDSVGMIAPLGFDAYLWSNGDTTATIYATTADTFHVTVFDAMGCSGTSQSFVTTVLAAPAQPMLTQVGDSLFSSSASNYQWYQDGNLIVGATDSFYIVTQSGYYSVYTENGNGCGITSDSLFVSPIGMPELTSDFKLWPNPFEDVIYIDYEGTSKDKQEVLILNNLGQKIYETNWNPSNGRLEMQPGELAPGVYFVIVRSAHNQVTFRLVSPE